MSEPKTLFGNDDASARIEEIKAEQERLNFEEKQKMGPKSLNFPISPAPAQATKPVQEKIKPLDLSHVSAPVPRAAPNPGALFDTKPVPYVNGAIKIAHEKFANLGTALESVERQIRQLVPLTISNVVTWGEPGVSQESELVTKAAGFIKIFSELRGNELCETALQASAQTNTGFFQRLAGGHGSVIGFKPNLINLKGQLMSMLPVCDEYVAKIDISHTKLAINLAALSSVCESIGSIEDNSLSVAVDNRRRILAQCVQQSDLTTQQLKQTKNLLVDQLSRASQLLDVTIPAFESAHAVK